MQGALAQARTALKPDGLLLAAMLGGDTLQELRIACSLAEQEREGGVSSRVSPLAQVQPWPMSTCERRTGISNEESKRFWSTLYSMVLLVVLKNYRTQFAC